MSATPNQPDKTVRPKDLLVKDLNATKDEFWWVHHAYKGKGAFDLTSAGSFPEGSQIWVRSDEVDPNAMESAEACMPVGLGDFADFAQVLYKLNGYRPGAVKGWYVVVCVQEKIAWAVGQLRADTVHPLQLFSDLVFETEDEAVNKAAELRLQNPGAIRLAGEMPVGNPVERRTAETIALEREYNARLSGFSRSARPKKNQQTGQTQKEAAGDPTALNTQATSKKAASNKEEGK
ncbi:hypothetical protein [Roseobacter weihaiensis]|uniref:hypothetical protein n=1 Tax=Roseobacter weihaiensis TaxID=2763262 RepID=UPI001D0A0B78|nr:hypothetical protein [Roseobacter sp. H9]